MGRADYYKDGTNNAICDYCGKKFKANKLLKTWDGLWVCRNDFEVRHPQDYVRGVRDDTRPELSRPEAQNVFVEEAQDLPIPPAPPPLG